VTGVWSIHTLVRGVLVRVCGFEYLSASLYSYKRYCLVVLWWESAIADCHLIWDGAHVVVWGESRRVVNVTSIVNIIILPLGQKRKPENS
jgi:hypothetical protein